MILVDSHCHLDQLQPEQLVTTVRRAREAGVVHAIVVGQFQKQGDFGDALSVAATEEDFFSPTMGIHPHESANATDSDFLTLAELCRQTRVVAIGEAGLDYYYDRSPRDVQRAAFARQCQLATELKKPLVVHVREAHAACLEILKSEGVSVGVIHCFTGGLTDARNYLNLGFHISASGIVTYKKTDQLQEAFRFVPLDRLLVETDSPYLAPVPFRGMTNEPAFVAAVAKRVAELKGLSADELALQTARNSSALFGFTLSS
jgi:TatD DNase family protein